MSAKTKVTIYVDTTGRNPFEKSRNAIKLIEQALVDANNENPPLGGALYSMGEKIGCYIVEFQE